MVFDRGQTTCMHCIVPRESNVVESRVFLEVFTKYIDCIVPYESWVPKLCTVLYLVKFGVVEGVRQGSDNR